MLSSRLKWSEAGLPWHRCILALYQACRALRSAHAHFRNPERTVWTATAVGGLLALRWLQAPGDWLFLVSMHAGETLEADSPVLRPHLRRCWKTEFSSESPAFGNSSPAPELPNRSRAPGGPGGLAPPEGLMPDSGAHGRVYLRSLPDLLAFSAIGTLTLAFHVQPDRCCESGRSVDRNRIACDQSS